MSAPVVNQSGGNARLIRLVLDMRWRAGVAGLILTREGNRRAEGSLSIPGARHLSRERCVPGWARMPPGKRLRPRSPRCSDRAMRSVCV